MVMDLVTIFENAMDMGGSQFFAELAFVEVSVDGIEYHRFPCPIHSTQTNGQVNGFEALWPTMFKALQVSI